jgi:hypothetical protein
MLVTGYKSAWVYWFKVLRMFEVKRANIVIGLLTNKLTSFRFCKKVWI